METDCSELNPAKQLNKPKMYKKGFWRSLFLHYSVIIIHGIVTLLDHIVTLRAHSHYKIRENIYCLWYNCFTNHFTSSPWAVALSAILMTYEDSVTFPALSHITVILPDIIRQTIKYIRQEIYVLLEKQEFRITNGDKYFSDIEMIINLT